MKRNALRWMAPVLALLLCWGAALAGPWVTVTGTSWNAPVNVSLDLGGALGQFSWDDVASSFDFGPQGSLGRQVFTWTCDEEASTEQVWGTFKPQKERVKLTISTMKLNTVLKDCIQAASAEGDNVLKSLSIKIKRVNELGCTTGRDRRGVWLKFKVRMEFEYSLKLNGKAYKGTGTYAAGGTGRR